MQREGNRVTLIRVLRQHRRQGKTLMKTGTFGQSTAQRWANSTDVNHRAIQHYVYMSRSRLRFYTRTLFISESLRIRRAEEHKDPLLYLFITICNTLYSHTHTHKYICRDWSSDMSKSRSIIMFPSWFCSSTSKIIFVFIYWALVNI